MESARGLRGIIVATREEGIILGEIQGIQIDPAAKQIAALTIRAKKGTNRNLFIKCSDVEKIGEDLILIHSKGNAEPYDKPENLPGTSLKELQGAWVTTMEGKHLGTLVDVDFSAKDWMLTELELAERKSIPVDPIEIRIGDEILVPTAYVNRIKTQPKEKYGAMGRLLGQERIDDVRDAIGRVIKRQKEEEKTTTTRPEGRPRPRA